MLPFLIAACALFSTTALGHIDVGVCPDIVDKYDFDPVPYLGRWYEAQRFHIVYEIGQDCVNTIYDDLGDGYIGVHNMGRSTSGNLTDISGKAHLIAPGVLSVEFLGYPAGDYHVLGTDYENFSCVYDCGQDGPLRTQHAWLLTRAKIPDEATFEIANEVFARNGIDVSLFHRTHQGDDCPYVV
ncbi:apolipoprotein D-like [Palaemon carinicauda]|uniref:apolipoprotein D-like n=1 Tax=Palaemon carinicauda TaxID=392227 RepID=UPI0035B60DFE